VYTLIAADVERANADLPPAARVRRFVLLHKELDADDDEITRTRKLRRRVIAERYRTIIDALYEPALDRVRVEADVRYQDGRQARIRATLHLYDMDAAPPEGRPGDHVDGLLVVA
jgi:long-chain acyl-CoA synthetase